MSSSPVIVRFAKRADYPAIAALLDRVLGPISLEKRLKLWQWRSEANPARTDSIPPFLVGELRDRIVAVHGLLPIRVKVRERILLASCSCDLAADPSARSAGLKVKLAAMNPKLSPLHISTSANSAANEITLALGGKEVNIGRRKLIKPLKVSGIMHSILRKKFGPSVASLGQVITLPLDGVLAAVQKVKVRSRATDARIEEISKFNSRFDRLWEGISRDAEIMHVRDAAYLDWRYAKYPFPGVQSFALSRGDDVLGLAVIHFSVDHNGLKFVAILELLVVENDPSIFNQLLREIVRRAADASAHSITVKTSTPSWDAEYQECGFKVRLSPFSPVTYKNSSEFADELFAADTNWYISLGDGDGCYYFN